MKPGSQWMWKFAPLVCLIAGGWGLACRPERHAAPAQAPTPRPAPARREAPTPSPAPTPASPRMGDKLTTEGLRQHHGEPGIVKLTWKTQSEENSFGFYVMRAREAKGPFEPVNKAPLLGAGVSSTEQTYVYYDTSVKVGESFHYFVRQVDLDGTTKDFTDFTGAVMVSRLNLDAATTGTASGAGARGK